MLEYHDYKTLHIASSIVFFFGLSRIYANEGMGRYLKAFFYSSVILSFFTGLLLVLRWGLMEAFPIWVVGKFIIHLTLIGTIWFPKIKGQKAQKLLTAYALFAILIMTGLSVYKPF